MSGPCFELFRRHFFGKDWHAFFNVESFVLAVVVNRGHSFLGLCVGLTPAWQSFGFSSALVAEMSAGDEEERVRGMLSSLALFRSLRSPFVACRELTDGHMLHFEARLGARRQVDVAVLFAPRASSSMQDMLSTSAAEASAGFWHFLHDSLLARDAASDHGAMALWRGDDETATSARFVCSWCGFDFVFRVVPMLSREEQQIVLPRCALALVYGEEGRREESEEEWMSEGHVGTLLLCNDETANLEVVSRTDALADAFVPPSEELYRQNGRRHVAEQLPPEQLGDQLLASLVALHYQATAVPLERQRSELELMMGHVQPLLAPTLFKEWFSINGKPRFVALSSRGMLLFDREVSDAKVEEEGAEGRERPEWAAQQQAMRMMGVGGTADSAALVLVYEAIAGVELCGSKVMVRIANAEPLEVTSSDASDVGLKQLFHFMTSSRPELLRGDMLQGYLNKVKKGGKMFKQKRVWCSLDDKGSFEVRAKPGGPLLKSLSLLGATADTSQDRIALQKGPIAMTLSGCTERGSPALTVWAARIRGFLAKLQWPDLAEGVPDFFTDAADELEARLSDPSKQNQSDAIGMFRISGAQGEVEALCARWQFGGSFSVAAEETAVLCGALRCYLRSFGGLLREHDEWCAACSVPNMADRLAIYTRLLQQQSPESVSLLFRLLSLLNAVQCAVARTRMDAGALAVVFAPVFLHAPDERAMLATVDSAVETVRFLIVHYRCCHLGLASSAWRHAHQTGAEDRRENVPAAEASRDAAVPFVTSPVQAVYATRRRPNVSSPHMSVSSLFPVPEREAASVDAMSDSAGDAARLSSSGQSFRTPPPLPSSPPPRSSPGRSAAQRSVRASPPAAETSVAAPSLSPRLSSSSSGRAPPPAFAPPPVPATGPPPMKRRATAPALPQAVVEAAKRGRVPSEHQAAAPIPSPRKRE